MNELVVTIASLRNTRNREIGEGLSLPEGHRQPATNKTLRLGSAKIEILPRGEVMVIPGKTTLTISARGERPTDVWVSPPLRMPGVIDRTTLLLGIDHEGYRIQHAHRPRSRAVLIRTANFAIEA